MTGGAFSPAARAAVLNATLGRCAGCGTAWQLEVHHRRPRGMGGTSRAEIGEPFNGAALCARCHGWAESHRDTARLLGWLTPAPHPATPWWTRQWGWVVWVILDGDGPPCWCVAFTDTTDPDRVAAVNDYKRWRRKT